jgi:type I restriction enzyme S subunit
MELPVLVPPASEQTVIATFLDRETARIDALIGEQQRLIALLTEKRQAVISHAVTKGLDPTVPMKDSRVAWLGEVPGHWEVTRLKFIASVQMGPFGEALKDLSSSDTGFKLYGQENTIKGDFEIGQRWLSANKFTELSRYEIIPGDLVVTRKGSIGKCRIIPHGISRGIADSDTIRIRAESQLIDQTILQTLLHDADYVSVQINSNTRGAILSGLNTSSIGDLVLAVPPLCEQADLASFLDQETARIDALIADANHAITLLQERRTSLITAAVTGQIDVRAHAEALPA